MSSPAQPSYAEVAASAAASGLRLRGGVLVRPGDAVPDLAPGVPARTLVLLGNVGASLWADFVASGYLDGRPDPLDDWSRDVIGEMARELGARALFPFGGPPFHPFLRWAERAEPVWPSVMGPLIHPRYGLWHAYRGALAFAHPMTLPGAQPVGEAQRPCERCERRPCLTGCPVDAIEEGHYDVARCVDYLRENPGCDCLQQGCRARRNCPVGRDAVYPPAQARHHMEAFVRNNR